MEIINEIKQTVESHPIVLFMKGTPQFPMCGFSSRTSQALKAVGAEFHSVNVLEHPEIRANLPRFSNWPTFPQLFINGELIGGCDITIELYEKGELAQMVREGEVGLSEAAAPVRPWAGRVVLVTGPTGGLGGAFARAAARRGATLVLAGRHMRQVERLLDEIIELGGTDSAIYPINFEGASPLDYEQLATTVENECGRLDVLVHAAAQFEGLISIEEIGAESWLKPFQVNCHAAQWLTQTTLSMLLASKGQVVFPLEDEERIQRPFWNAYGASKAALATMARHYAEELESRSVRVHEFRPGPMRTALRAKAYFGEDSNTVPLADSKLPPLFAAMDAHWAR